MTKLAKKDLINELQEKSRIRGLEITKKDAATLFSAFEDTMIEAIHAADEVGYDSFSTNFGTFKIVEVPEKSGVSRLGGEEKSWTSPAHKTVRFKLNKSVKDKLKAETSK